MLDENSFTTKIGEHEIIISSGKLAEQAGGAVTARVGDSMVLATATMSKNTREGLDFFPLSVDFEEKMYAAGRIPGGFFRREGRPSTEAILTCRLTDRPLRPLFPKGMRNEVQVIITTLSSDSEYHLDILSLNAASCAGVARTTDRRRIPHQGRPPTAAYKATKAPRPETGVGGAHSTV